MNPISIHSASLGLFVGGIEAINSQNYYLKTCSILVVLWLSWCFLKLLTNCPGLFSLWPFGTVCPLQSRILPNVSVD